MKKVIIQAGEKLKEKGIDAFSVVQAGLVASTPIADVTLSYQRFNSPTSSVASSPSESDWLYEHPTDSSVDSHPIQSWRITAREISRELGPRNQTDVIPLQFSVSTAAQQGTYLSMDSIMDGVAGHRTPNCGQVNPQSYTEPLLRDREDEVYSALGQPPLLMGSPHVTQKLMCPPSVIPPWPKSAPPPSTCMVGPMNQIPLLAQPRGERALNRVGSTLTVGQHGAGRTLTPVWAGPSAHSSLRSTSLPLEDLLSESLDTLQGRNSPREGQQAEQRVAAKHDVPAKDLENSLPRDRAQSGLVNLPQHSRTCEEVLDDSIVLAPITKITSQGITPSRAGNGSRTGSSITASQESKIDSDTNLSQELFLRRENINQNPDQWEDQNARRHNIRTHSSKDYGHHKQQTGNSVPRCSPKSRIEEKREEQARYDTFRAGFAGSGDGAVSRFPIPAPSEGGSSHSTSGKGETENSSGPEDRQSPDQNLPTGPGHHDNPDEPDESGDDSPSDSSSDEDPGRDGDPPRRNGANRPPASSGKKKKSGKKTAGQKPSSEVAHIVAALGNTMVQLQADNAKLQTDSLLLYSQMMRDTLNDAVKPAFDAIPVIGTAMQAMQSQANDKGGKLIGVPLFSGDTDNEKLPAAERARIEPNVGVFAERIKVAVDVPHMREVDKVRQLHLHLKGSASEQLLMLPQDGVYPHTFSELLNLVRWTFQPADLNIHLLRELMYAKRGKNESLNCYLIRLKRLRIKVSNAAPHFDEGLDVVLYQSLIRGVDTDILAALETQTRISHNDFESIVAYIKKYSLLHRDKAPPGMGPSKVYQDSVERGKLVNACGISSLDPSVNIVSAESLCFQCRRPGHLARDCPLGAQTQTIAKSRGQNDSKGLSKFKGKRTSGENKDNSTLTCIVCRKPGHIAKNCYIHQRSVTLIKKRFEVKKEDPPKEIYAVGLTPEEHPDPMRQLLREQINWTGYEEEDIDHAITCSLTLQSQMGNPEETEEPDACSEEEERA